ncbi:hypothetical protein J3459_004065 [Metarhizium acridum]|nr:hypothetical protein J3459_004065 [Metarhizium acridum]
MLAIRAPSVAKHRYIPPSTCHGIYELLWRFEPQVDGERWTNKKFGLCCNCLQYRPRKKILLWKLFARKHRRTRKGSQGGIMEACCESLVRRMISPVSGCYCKETYAILPTQGQWREEMRHHCYM